MQKFRLKNGLTVIIDRRPKSKSVAIEMCVKVGSNNETPKIAGISHFFEHMLFEGTTNRTASQIANEIEKVGGEFNAATTHERTFYYAKVPAKHFERALDVMADIMQNSTFDQKAIDKERKVIMDEINLVTDDPRNHQWVLFLSKLFKKHPTKNPIYGSKDTVSKISRDDLLKYFDVHYVPNNMIVSVVGNVDGSANKIKDYFEKMKRKEHRCVHYGKEPSQTKDQIFKEKRKINQSYVVLGYKAAHRSHPDSYVFDVIRSILGRGQSGKLFIEVRMKRGLAYEVGAYHEAAREYGFFGAYLSTNKKNINNVKSIILNEIKGLNNISDKDLNEAKTYLEGEFLLSSEDNIRRGEHLCAWETNAKAELVDKYLDKIRKITKKDVSRVIKKYMKHHTMIVIEQG